MKGRRDWGTERPATEWRNIGRKGKPNDLAPEQNLSNHDELNTGAMVRHQERNDLKEIWF